MIQSIKETIFPLRIQSSRKRQNPSPLTFSSSFNDGNTINPKAVESLAASVFKKFALYLAVITTAITVSFEALKKHINGFLVSTADNLEAIQKEA
jgi:hypothetical protein